MRRLAELRARIARLQARLELQEAARREARDALRDSERAISASNRKLAQLAAQARTLHDQAARNARERSTLERTLGQRQATLARVLAARYETGAPDALRVALSGEPPAEVARKLHYIVLASQATARLVTDIRKDIGELDRLRQMAEARSARLAELQAAQRAQRSALLAEQHERRQVLDRVAVELKSGRRRMRILREDETHLSILIEELGRVVADTRAGPGSVEQITPGVLGSRPFSRLRGMLHLPVRGELTGRYGAPRERGGPGAKGIFIHAAAGRPVRAIAAGQVVFADWMRGFGNLIIIDHGETYLSIYANNEALLKQVGDVVAAGEVIATVGATGGNEETGLYFELRRSGKAIDPMRWISRR